jgi:siroheme decarboxylase
MQKGNNNHFNDDLDRMLINRLQTDFPVSARPYRDIGDELGVSEDEVIERLSRLKKSGVIRRIGANIVPKKIGYTSTLCAAKVDPDRIDRFAEIVNRNPGVTHNYLRKHDYNVWFTVIAPSMADIERFLEDVKQETGVADIINMPATKVFKLRAEFTI